MKGRHQFKRRFSLQPSFLKEEPEDDRHHHNHGSQRNEDTDTAHRSDSAPGTSSVVRHKIVVMGSAKVGKSSIISQFLYNTFSLKYKRTVEEMHHGDFNVAGVQLTLDILDTSGAYEFPAMRALSISSADAFVLVYDVNDADTFEEVRALRDQIHETKGGTAVPIVVVGNKTDLQQRQIDTDTTESVVTVDWENGFVETSAKDNVNVSKVFKELLNQAKVKYSLSPALRRRRRQSLPSQPPNASAPSTPPVTHPLSSSSSSSSSHHQQQHQHQHQHQHQQHHQQYHQQQQSAGAVPSAVQLQHLQQIRDRHGKRNSCAIS